MPVIWTCRSDCNADMHFDTRQYNHILWAGAAAEGARAPNQRLAALLAPKLPKWDF